MVAKNTVANTQQKRLSIGIVGGGIGGVAFAVALSRDSQLDVQLFEAAPQFSEIGAGVSFGPNAVKAIQRLGLEASYQRIADSSPAPFEDVWFEWRRGSDDAYLTASLAPGVGQSSVHRADFLDAIVANLPEGIAHFGKRCVEVKQDADSATAYFDDGTHFTGDVIIGFDGIKSAVRRHVLPPEQYGEINPFWSGTYAYRGMIPTDELEAALEAKGSEKRLALVPQMYLGKDRHILTFPLAVGIDRAAHVVLVLRRVKERVAALGVAVPDLDLGAGDRLTVHVAHLAGEPHGLAIRVAAIVHPRKAFRLGGAGHVERTFDGARGAAGALGFGVDGVVAHIEEMVKPEPRGQEAELSLAAQGVQQVHGGPVLLFADIEVVDQFEQVAD